MNHVINLSSLNVTLGGIRILNGLSLEVPRGQWCSVVGPSGCGKSTLLRAMARLIPVEAESFKTDYQTPAFVFQDPTLMPWRNVSDNVGLPLELSGSKRQPEESIDRLTIDETIQLVGLDVEDLTKFPRQLSGGMRMRVSMARALVTRPDILFMDEPFAALDELLRQQLNQLIHEICREQQLTTLFVTHNVSEAVYLSNRVLIMNRHGEIVSDVEITLPESRTAELRVSADYLAVVREVTEKLQEAME